MKIRYKNKALEVLLTIVTLLTAVVVAATFVMLYGFYEPLMSAQILSSFTAQIFSVRRGAIQPLLYAKFQAQEFLSSILLTQTLLFIQVF